MLHFDIDLSDEIFGIRPSLMLGKEFKDRVCERYAGNTRFKF